MWLKLASRRCFILQLKNIGNNCHMQASLHKELLLPDDDLFSVHCKVTNSGQLHNRICKWCFSLDLKDLQQSTYHMLYIKLTNSKLKHTVIHYTNIMDDLYLTSNSSSFLSAPPHTALMVTHHLGCAPWWGAIIHLLPWPGTPSALSSPLVRETWRVSSLFLPPSAVAGVLRGRGQATSSPQAQIFSPVKRHWSPTKGARCKNVRYFRWWD